MSNVTEAQVMQALSTVLDPDIKKPLTELGMIENVAVCDDHVAFEIKLTTTACPLKEHILNEAKAAVEALEGVKGVKASISKNTVTLQAGVQEQQRIPGIKNIIAISSGKGGVGKSTVTVNLACAMAQQGAKVGILDADIYGPNVPSMMGVHGQKLQAAAPKEDGGKAGIIPAQAYGVKMMSMAFLLKDDQPVVWRGPMLDKVIRQFLNDTEWGELDYLLIDLPPGTGDAQLTIIQATPVVGAVIVTTPQNVALLDSRKGLAMFKNSNIPILGMVENMSYHVCSSCGHEEHIFGTGGGEAAAAEIGVPFLGRLPLHMHIRQEADAGRPIVVAQPESSHAEAMNAMAHQVIGRVCELGVTAAQANPLSHAPQPTPVG